MFRDTEPLGDACFRCVLADLEMFLEVGMHAFPKSLINTTRSDIE